MWVRVVKCMQKQILFFKQFQMHLECQPATKGVNLWITLGASVGFVSSVSWVACFSSMAETVFCFGILCFSNHYVSIYYYFLLNPFFIVFIKHPRLVFVLPVSLMLSLKQPSKDRLIPNRCLYAFYTASKGCYVLNHFLS